MRSFRDDDSGVPGHPFARWWAGALVLASLPTQGDPPLPPQKPGPKGATGSVIEYQEKPSGGILYMEESGGLLSPLPPAPPGRARIAPPDATLPSIPPSMISARKKPLPPTAVVRKGTAPPAVAARRAPPAAPSWAERIDRAIEAQDDATVIALAKAADAVIDCARADRSWSIAKALDEANRSEERRVGKECRL